MLHNNPLLSCPSIILPGAPTLLWQWTAFYFSNTILPIAVTSGSLISPGPPPASYPTFKSQGQLHALVVLATDSKVQNLLCRNFPSSRAKEPCILITAVENQLGALTHHRYSVSDHWITCTFLTLLVSSKLNNKWFFYNSFLLSLPSPGHTSPPTCPRTDQAAKRIRHSCGCWG